MNRLICAVIIASALLSQGCSDDEKPGTIGASGTIEAVTVIVSAKVSGEVTNVLKEEGALIKSGDTILTIDRSTLELQLKQTEAGLQTAQARLNLLKSGARKEDIVQAEQMLRQAQINLENATRDKERMESLYSTNSVTKKQYEDAVARYELALSQHTSSEQNLHRLKNLARPEELKQAEANLNKNAASVELLRKTITDTYVTAPVSGFIVKRFVEKGETVSPLSSVFKIADLSSVELVIYVPQTQLGKVKLGQKAKVTVDTFSDKSFNGTVVYISPEAEFTPKNIQTKDERTKLVFAVKIKVENPRYELKTGMPADAEINLN